MEGYISGRFFSASENESQKAFEGRNGKIRSENNSNHLPKPAEASWARDSNGRSSVINVDDLGFSESGPLIQPITGPRDREFMSVEMLRENLNLAPKNDTSVKESIREKIKLSLVRSHSDYYGAKDRRFLPIDKLNTILSDESIKALLLEEYSQIAEQDLNCKLGDYTSRRRILGILLFMYPAHLRLFECFINEKIADKDLPLTPNGGTDEIGFQTRLGIKNTTMLMKWEDNDITLFYNYQPIFLAPFFYIQEDRLCNYSLDETIRLPWLKYTFINRGGNGKVHKVEIHPSHHNFINHQSSSSPVCFALKEIPTLDVDTYQQELLALEKTCVQMRKERHLIKLLLTFQHGQKYYLLFECADSNLWDYWSKYSNGPKDAGVSSLWMAEQCLGLATAVKRIHGLATWQKKRRDESGAVNEDEREWGRHGDIKPQNILCFSSSMKDDGLLVLSDLGLTRYHSSVTRSQVSPTSIDGCTKLYRPPEMDMPGQHICSKYDIWSLGCVFLELCTWWLRGLRSVQEFESRRDNSDRIFANLEYFFISETDGVAEPRVKDTVLEWITELRVDAKDDLFAEQMLNLIETQMLVVDKKRRSPADRVCMEILSMVDQLRKASRTSLLTSHGCVVNSNHNDLYNISTKESGDIGLSKRQKKWETQASSLTVDTSKRGLGSSIGNSSDDDTANEAPDSPMTIVTISSDGNPVSKHETGIENLESCLHVIPTSVNHSLSGSSNIKSNANSDLISLHNIPRSPYSIDTLPLQDNRQISDLEQNWADEFQDRREAFHELKIIAGQETGVAMMQDNFNSKVSRNCHGQSYTSTPAITDENILIPKSSQIDTSRLNEQKLRRHGSTTRELLGSMWTRIRHPASLIARASRKLRT